MLSKKRPLSQTDSGKHQVNPVKDLFSTNVKHVGPNTAEPNSVPQGLITLLCLLDKYLTRGRKPWLHLCTRKARRLTLLTIVLFIRLAFFCKLMERVIAAEVSDYLLSIGRYYQAPAWFRR